MRTNIGKVRLHKEPVIDSRNLDLDIRWVSESDNKANKKQSY